MYNYQQAEVGARQILRAIEGDCIRKELEDTPARVARAYKEMLDGYDVDMDALFRTFEGGVDQLVIAKDICAYSLCEHHLLPFSIRATVAYLPRDKVIGASKLERIVVGYAHRLQLQERIAEQVANTVMKGLDPLGVAVIIEGEHLCMKCRGINSKEGKFVNSIMLGKFRDDSSLRMELLLLLNGGK